MAETDGLVAIAEISVAFAGFASIVSVLGRRETRAHPRVDAIRVRGMVFCSTVVALGALFPFAAIGYRLDPVEAWRVASIGLLVLSGINLLSFAVDSRRSFDLFPRWQSILGTTLVGAIIITVPTLCIVNLAISDPWVQSANYRLGLLMLLCVAAGCFVFTLISLLAPSVDS